MLKQPHPVKLLFTSPGLARDCKFQARIRPGPQHKVTLESGLACPRGEARPVQDPILVDTEIFDVPNRADVVTPDSPSLHPSDTICHPKSGYVTTKLHGTSTCRCNNNAILQTELFSSFLQSTHAGHVNLAAVKPWQFMPNWKHGSTVEFIIFRV